MNNPIETEIVVVGAGPGGYAAAFYAADKGKKVLLIEKDDRLGGVCLNRGCIPSKALLNASHMIHAAKESAERGISFGEPTMDLDRLREWKNSVVTKLSGGIQVLAKNRGVETMKGRGYFEGSNTLRVETSEGQQFVKYDKAIIAVGSSASMPRVFDLGNPRVMTSRGALEIEEIPDELLVIGGGYIGMELGTVYSSMGSQVTVIEALPTILAGADPDLARPVLKLAESRFKEIRLGAKVTSMATKGAKIEVSSQLADGEKLSELYDRVLVSVGRSPNSKDIGLENTGVVVSDRGFVEVDKSQKTADSNIYAIGDITGGYMLAHKASKEARIAIEAICGEESIWDDFVVPAIVFTDPEVAWCGLTEQEAKEQGRKVEVARFPWAASGRALTYDRTDGLTKLLVDPDSERILGVGIVGHGAGELIGEATLAVEMGASVSDLAETIHPHPTLSETLMESAEAFFGHATHTVSRSKSKV